MSTTIRRSGPAVKRAHDPWNSADREPLDRSRTGRPGATGEERDRGEAAEEGRSAETDRVANPVPDLERVRSARRAVVPTPPPRSRSPSSGSRIAPTIRRPPAPRAGAEPEPVAWAPSARRHAEARSRASQILAARGLDPAEIEEIVRLLRGYRSPRSLRSGTLLRFAFAPIDSASDAVPTHRSRADARLHAPLRSRGPVWTARMDVVPFVMDTARISRSSSRASGRRVWAATSRDSGRAGSRISSTISRTSSPGRSISRGISGGDVLRVALERKVRPDGSVRSRHFLAIELRNQDRVFRAIRSRVRAAAGRTSTRTGARCTAPSCATPCRIASRAASRRRYHPILRRYRSHEGIDYGAPPGTPVEATASGVVARAGYAGGTARRRASPRARDPDALRAPERHRGRHPSRARGAGDRDRPRRLLRPRDRAAPALRVHHERAPPRPAHRRAAGPPGARDLAPGRVPAHARPSAPAPPGHSGPARSQRRAGRALRAPPAAPPKG